MNYEIGDMLKYQNERNGVADLCLIVRKYRLDLEPHTMYDICWLTQNSGIPYDETQYTHFHFQDIPAWSKLT